MTIPLSASGARMRPEALGDEEPLACPELSANPRRVVQSAREMLPSSRSTHTRKMEYSKARQLVPHPWPAVREHLPVSTWTDTTVPSSGFAAYSIRLLGCAHHAGASRGTASPPDIAGRWDAVIRRPIRDSVGLAEVEPDQLTRFNSALGSFAFVFTFSMPPSGFRETLPRARSPRPGTFSPLFAVRFSLSAGPAVRRSNGVGALGAYAVEDILHREADDARLGGRAGHRVRFARVGLPRVTFGGDNRR